MAGAAPQSKPAARASDAGHAAAVHHEAIVLFDGVCNLCNRSVDFIIRRDPAGVFRFASLQSEAGRAMLTQHNLPVDALNTMVLIEGGRAFICSSAALRIARRLRFPWPLFVALLVIPRPIRDVFYRVITRNRYRWFGRSESCRVPTPELTHRFLE